MEFDQEKFELAAKQSPITMMVQYKKDGGRKNLSGNRFTEDIYKMVIYLYRHAQRRLTSTSCIIMYDNRKSGSEQIIMKWVNGILKIDRSKEYGFSNIRLFNQ